MSETRARFEWSFLAPRYWALWLGVGLWWALSWLPYTWQLTLGRGLGLLLYRFGKRRCDIARCNLALCFPDWSEARREALVKQHLLAVGIAFFETGMAWFWPKWRLRRGVRIDGLEHLQQAQKDGVGVILMAFHFTHIDIGAKLLGMQFSIDGSYRPHKNPVMNYVQRRGRERHAIPGALAIARGDMRVMIKALRQGRAVWYAPDQDYGAKHSVFVPFFGVPAATITAASQLARLGRARIIPFVQMRLPHGGGYQLKIYPYWTDFPSADEVADALRINQFVEARVLEQPEAYLWVHRRFKTRPPGEPDLYSQRGVTRGSRDG